MDKVAIDQAMKLDEKLDLLSARFAKPVATVKTVLRRSLILLKECLGG